MTDATGAAASAIPTDPQSAIARKDELIADAAFREKVLNGDAEARKQLHDVNVAIVGPGQPTQEDALVAQHSLERARELGCDEGTIRQIANREPVSAQERQAALDWKKSHIADKGFIERLDRGDRQAKRELFIANVILASPLKPATA